MKVRITINTDNAAFEGDGAFFEIHRILDQVKGALLSACPSDSMQVDFPLRDINGNRVGNLRTTQD